MFAGHTAKFIAGAACFVGRSITCRVRENPSPSRPASGQPANRMCRSNHLELGKGNL
jgi:hypothetical protein